MLRFALASESPGADVGQNFESGWGAHTEQMVAHPGDRPRVAWRQLSEDKSNPRRLLIHWGALVSFLMLPVN